MCLKKKGILAMVLKKRGIPDICRILYSVDGGHVGDTQVVIGIKVKHSVILTIE
jgi:hypothetical protein